MSELCFETASHGVLSNVSGLFGTGIHVVVGTERDGTGTLLELAAGMLRPTTGSVRLAGFAPWSHARTRQRIASLFASETLLPARDVVGALALALRARGDSRSALSVLDGAGLAHFAKRRVSAVTRGEARSIALCLALSQNAPALLAVHEPLSAAGMLSQEFVLQSLNEHGERGAIVLCCTSRLEDAAQLGGTARTLERGSWFDVAEAEAALGTITLRVHTPEPRRLAARLSEAPDISGVEWPGGYELLVRGPDLDRLAHSVVANARAEAIRITALKRETPALEALAAARAGLAQAYYERAHRNATRQS